MFTPASSEFVALCQSQVALLTQGLEAALSIVYLTAELVEGASGGLVPIVIYPETAVVWEADRGGWRLPEETSYLFDSIRRLPTAALLGVSQTSLSDPNQPQIGSNQQDWEGELRRRSRQIVLPLMHEDVVMGLLVTSREDRPWNEGERVQIEHVANTLAIACMIDQRRAWLEHQLQAKQRFQEQQRDLLDDLLHQFRNPMTAIRTFGKLLIRRLRPGDANREVANSIVRESDRLQELLQRFDEAIDLNQTEIPPALRPETSKESGLDTLPVLLLPDSRKSPQEATGLCSVAQVLEPLLDSAKAIALERNLDLIAQIPPDLPPVQVDAKALREVLSNLIDNALKYTPAGGKVIVQAGRIRVSDRGKKQSSIAVSDTGPGIPPQDLEHIFERHYRGVQAKTEIPGTGLGLAIARELVEQMHGEIEVISPAVFNWADDSADQLVLNSSQVDDPPGPGTTFVVWLPCRDVS